MSKSTKSSFLKNGPNTFCSFCGIGEGDVDVLVSGPNVFICPNCAELAVSLVEDYRNNSTPVEAE
jgi:ATP-dependent protease Clp ATPase subunit